MKIEKLFRWIENHDFSNFVRKLAHKWKPHWRSFQCGHLRMRSHLAKIQQKFENCGPFFKNYVSKCDFFINFSFKKCEFRPILVCLGSTIKHLPQKTKLWHHMILIVFWKQIPMLKFTKTWKECPFLRKKWCKNHILRRNFWKTDHSFHTFVEFWLNNS